MGTVQVSLVIEKKVTGFQEIMTELNLIDKLPK